MIHPTPNSLVGHRHSALRQQILDVTQAEGEPEVEPNSLLNDLGRETIPSVADLVHPRAATRPPRTPQAQSAVTMPIATVLMRVGQRKYRNVIINLPPRHMKSALASILYPAWRLGCDPTVKFICISYGDDLAHELSAQTRKIMRSPLYKLIFPGTILDKSAVDHIRTTMGGYRYATAVGSDITGFGADEIIIDDPVQPEDALSERVKQQLRDWVDSSVY